VVTYHAPVGRYALTTSYFTAARTNGLLTAPRSTSTSRNGVYRYGSGGVFPTTTSQSSNYWVDVVFRSA
jgi:hypothetical protein